MRDPHVASLRYRLVPDEYTKFEEPPPLDWDQDGFSLHLEKNVATASMKVHFESVQKARESVDPRLRAWELDVALAQHGLPEIHFEFDEAEVVDRDPPPPDAPQVIKPDPLKVEVKVSAFISAHVTRKTYPRPPSRFIASPDVEVMWFRIKDTEMERNHSLPWPISASPLSRREVVWVGKDARRSLRS